MNAEKINALADLLETRTDLPFDIEQYDQCICGWTYFLQYGEKFEFRDPPISFLACEILFGRHSDIRWGSIIVPEGCYTNPSQYPRERAIAMLRNLALTGRVEW